MNILPDSLKMVTRDQLDRRTVLKGVTLGAGAVVLQPFLQRGRELIEVLLPDREDFRRRTLFEIVAVLGPDRRLWLYLDRHATSEPIDGATVQVSGRGAGVH